MKSTWIAAIRAENYCTWLGLSVKAVKECFSKSNKTQHGHMKGLRQGLRSTKEKVEHKKDKQPQEALKKEHDVYVKVIDLRAEIYTDQTGQFPSTSSKGNSYVMVTIYVDASFIFMEPIKNRTSGHMIETY